VLLEQFLHKEVKVDDFAVGRGGTGVKIGLWDLEILSHHIKQKLQLIPGKINISFLERLHEFILLQESVSC